MKFIPHAYQEKAIEFALSRGSCGLFLDMGLGKSVISLTVIKALKDLYFDLKKALVVAPKRVAEDTWPKEICKWTHLQDLTVSEIRGTPKQRTAALHAEADLYIVSRDNLSWLVDRIPEELGEWPYDTVILDELSSFKNPSSQRFKKLRKMLPHIKRVIGLTGTPAPNGYLDLWSQIYLLDRGERLEKTLTRFRSKYCDVIHLPGFNKYRMKPGAEREIDSLLKDLCISMKSKDYLILREPVRMERRAFLSPKERQVYERMQEEALIEFESGSEVAAMSAAAILNKLLQIASGSVYVDGEDYEELHDRKLEVLEDLIEEAQGEPVLVFYGYRSDKERILKRFPGARTLDTSKDIEGWNSGKISVLLAHPASAGHGLNLQDGGSIIIWYTLPWSLELYQQANARLQRQGQMETVRIYHIITDETVDEKVMHVLDGKHIRQEELLESLKAKLTP